MTQNLHNLQVGIDLTPLLAVKTGVDHYLLQLVRGLSQVERKIKFTIFTNWEDRKIVSANLGKNFFILPITFRNRPARFIAQQFLLPILSIMLRLDILHSPSFFMPLFRGNQRHILTVFDMTMFSLPQYHNRLRRSRAYRMGVAESIRRTDMIIVPSRFVRQELVRLLPDVNPDRIRVTPLGVETQFTPRKKIDDARKESPVKGAPSYILFVGTIQYRKGIETLIKSYQSAILSHQIKEHLVLVGQLGWEYQEIQRLVCLNKIQDRVHFTGYLDPEKLLTFYRGARLFVFPSIEEGFGLPPLEAMACGIPTLATDTSSLRENLHGAAKLVPPDDPISLSAAMIQMLLDAKIREDFRSKGMARAKRFRWEMTALRTIDCYGELSEKPSKLRI